MVQSFLLATMSDSREFSRRNLYSGDSGGEGSCSKFSFKRGRSANNIVIQIGSPSPIEEIKYILAVHHIKKHHRKIVRLPFVVLVGDPNDVLRRSTKKRD